MIANLCVLDKIPYMHHHRSSQSRGATESMSLFDELKRRNVFKVAVAYTIVGWLIMQAGEVMGPALHLPEWVDSVLAFFLILGFPLAMLFAWAFELTPEGLKLEKDVNREASTTPQPSKQLDRIIMIVLVLALGYFAFDKFVLDPARDVELVAETAQEARTEALLDSYGDKSIAVLPFVDMSPDGDQEYMSDGIAEELLNLLAKIPGLRVVSRSSSFAFKGKEINIPSVADQLNVAYVLEGSVRQAGDQLRITAQLIEAGTDTHLWSETYDRKLENIFQIQDEISAQVVEELKITLFGGAPKSKHIDEQAYKMVLQARFFWNRRDEGDVERALAHFEDALEISPEYAPAWAGVAWANSVLALGGQIDRVEGLRLARVAAEKSVELDPMLSDAHVRMGQAHARANEWPAAIASYRKALELDPNSPLAMGVTALQVWKTGDFDGSIAMFEKIEEMDPLSAIWPANRFTVLVRAGRYEEALGANERYFMLSGNRSGYDQNRAIVFELTGRYQESWELTEGAPDLPDPMAGKAMLLHHLDRPDEAEAMRLKLEQSGAPFTWFHMAKIYARWGDLDSAFGQLSEANVSQIPKWYLQYDPHLEALKSDPRWQGVLDSAIPAFAE